MSGKAIQYCLIRLSHTFTTSLMSKLIAFFGTLLLSITPAYTLAQNYEVSDTIFYPATGESRDVVIVMLGGSEGGMPNYYDTDGLTAAGYSCLIVGYFRTPNTPDRLQMIPLEYFEHVLDGLQSMPEVSGKKIVVWGGSKGGELALLLASRYNRIEGVIAAVPSAVVFQGIGAQRVSSWSYEGIAIPFVPYVDYDWSTIVDAQYIDMYEQSLDQTEAVKQAMIEVTNINGPILLLTGKEDTMWPSSEMGDMVIERLAEQGFEHGYWHFAYDDAGHTLNENHMMGGTKEGNKKARIDAKQRVMTFLHNISGD